MEYWQWMPEEYSQPKNIEAFSTNPTGQEKVGLKPKKSFFFLPCTKGQGKLLPSNPGLRLLASDFWLPTSASDFWLPTSGFRLTTPNLRLPPITKKEPR
jgi:hypothetical protein